MTVTAIVGGTVHTPSVEHSAGVVLYEDRSIIAVGPAGGIQIPESAQRVDATGHIVVPGLIDLHTHGLLGHDVMGPGLSQAVGDYPKFGVTSFMATTYAASNETMVRSLEKMAEVLDDPPPGARCLGIHLEGPHLSPEMPGAAGPESLHPLTWSEFQTLQSAAGGYVAMITFAPEEGEALDVIPRLVDVGVVPVIGHSTASYELVSRAVELGMTQASHTFNAMGRFHHRRPGTVGAVLTLNEVYAQLIGDGVHVHPAAVELLYRTKGPDRAVLISDSSPVAGLPDGRYEWQGRGIFVRGGRCVLEDGTLAGSHAMLDAGLRTVVEQTAVPFATVLGSATKTPAHSVGLGRKGKLEADYDADILILDQALRPVETFVEGNRIWARSTEGTTD